MKTAIDGFGRVVIPRPLRDRAALAAGTELDVRYEDGRIVLEPAPLSIRIKQVGRFFVADAVTPVPTLYADDVERELETLRAGTEMRGLSDQDARRARPKSVRRKRRKRQKR